MGTAGDFHTDNGHSTPINVVNDLDIKQLIHIDYISDNKI